MSYVTLGAGELGVVVGDNEAGQGDLASHKAGYNGVWSLRSEHCPENCFAPAYAGLNLEHYFDDRFGEIQDQRQMAFEPRHAPMHLSQLEPHAALLHQPPTPTYAVESWTEFRLRPPHMLDFHYRARLHAPPRGGWIGAFWASYIHAPEDPGICFLGHWPDSPQQTGWLKLATDAHGRDSTIAPHNAGQSPAIRQAGTGRPWLFTRFSHRRFVEPFFYGRPGDGRMMLLFVFEDSPGLRITQSPSGGGWNEAKRTWNPAWDFQHIAQPAAAGQELSLRARVVYKPYAGRQEILDLLARWREDLANTRPSQPG